MLRHAVRTIMFTFFDPVKGLEIYNCNDMDYESSDEDMGMTESGRDHKVDNLEPQQSFTNQHDQIKHNIEADYQTLIMLNQRGTINNPQSFRNLGPPMTGMSQSSVVNTSEMTYMDQSDNSKYANFRYNKMTK